MKCFKYEGADRDNLSLQIALQEIESLPDDDECFIGFVNEKKETIQFIRREEDSWLIDVPIVENDKFNHSLQDTDLTTEKVKDVVRKFYLDENWKSLCNLTEQ